MFRLWSFGRHISISLSRTARFILKCSEVLRHDEACSLRGIIFNHNFIDQEWMHTALDPRQTNPQRKKHTKKQRNKENKTKLTVLCELRPRPVLSFELVMTQASTDQKGFLMVLRYHLYGSPLPHSYTNPSVNQRTNEPTNQPTNQPTL